MKIYHFAGCLLLLFLISCSVSNRINNQLGYFQEILDWRQERLQALQAPEGWPTLAGLYWLKEGTNTYGAAAENDIKFPDNAPDNIGIFTLNNGIISYETSPNLNIRCNGEIRPTGVLYDAAKSISEKLQTRSLIWYAIQRGDQFGIRLKDTLHPNRIALQEIPNYPIQEKWVYQAKFITAKSTDTVMIKNQVGMHLPSPIAGWIEFKHAGAKHRLTALNNDMNSYFVIISDLTTGNETYGGGRFLYPSKEDANGNLLLDFNRAENPPCVFTDFATCPLPPLENDLPFAVEAGEKVVNMKH